MFETKKITKICKDAGLIPIRLHNLRHSHIALLIDNHCDKKQMEQASITITIDTYGHLFPNKQKSMSVKIDHLF